MTVKHIEMIRVASSFKKMLKLKAVEENKSLYALTRDLSLTELDKLKDEFEHKRRNNDKRIFKI